MCCGNFPPHALPAREPLGRVPVSELLPHVCGTGRAPGEPMEPPLPVASETPAPAASPALGWRSPRQLLAPGATRHLGGQLSHRSSQSWPQCPTSPGPACLTRGD